MLIYARDILWLPLWGFIQWLGTFSFSGSRRQGLVSWRLVHAWTRVAFFVELNQQVVISHLFLHCTLQIFLVKIHVAICLLFSNWIVELMPHLFLLLDRVDRHFCCLIREWPLTEFASGKLLWSGRLKLHRKPVCRGSGGLLPLLFCFFKVVRLVDVLMRYFTPQLGTENHVVCSPLSLCDEW